MLINGAPVNDVESGGLFWSRWGGLNDVMRNRTSIVGLDASSFAFGEQVELLLSILERLVNGSNLD